MRQILKDILLVIVAMSVLVGLTVLLVAFSNDRERRDCLEQATKYQTMCMIGIDPSSDDAMYERAIQRCERVSELAKTPCD